MVVKVYISGISGNKEVKKRQQRVLMILDSKNIKYEIIDITEPGREDDKDFMQNNSKSNGGTVSDPNPRSPLPPQLFNDDEYCGDYDQFDLANEVDTLEQFLKVEVPADSEDLLTDKIASVNGEVISEENEPRDNAQDTEDTGDSTNKSIEPNEKPIESDSPGLVVKDDLVERALSQEKESSPARQNSAEESESPIETTTEPKMEDKQKSKEVTPDEVEVINENGEVSSREQSEEKQEISEQKKENPSEAFIQSEQAVASD